MRRRIIRPSIVDDDLEAIFLYIAKDSLKAALRFVAAAEQTFDYLVEMAESGSRYPFCSVRLRNIWVWPIRRFRKYLVLYRFNATTLELVRVVSGYRNLERLLLAPYDAD